MQWSSIIARQRSDISVIRRSNIAIDRRGSPSVWTLRSGKIPSHWPLAASEDLRSFYPGYSTWHELEERQGSDSGNSSSPGCGCLAELCGWEESAEHDWWTFAAEERWFGGKKAFRIHFENRKKRIEFCLLVRIRSDGLPWGVCSTG